MPLLKLFDENRRRIEAAASQKFDRCGVEVIRGATGPKGAAAGPVIKCRMPHIPPRVFEKLIWSPWELAPRAGDKIVTVVGSCFRTVAKRARPIVGWANRDPPES
jgi:hypothetical protein